LFEESPTLFGSLSHVFQVLDSAYDESSGQGMPMAQYNHIAEHLTKPLLEVLDAESAGSEKLLHKLDNLHTALNSL
jgi:hypothetical protein